MNNLYSFSIRIDPRDGEYPPGIGKCPLCDDHLTEPDDTPGVYDEAGRVICEICSWDLVPELASLVALAIAAQAHGGKVIPPDIFHVLEKRRSNPELLKKQLTEARENLSRRIYPSGGSPLAELVAHEIEAALRGDDVPIMRNALKAYQETTTGDEIPF